MLLMNNRSIVFAYTMREWLSGGASPSQGEGRGFESRLALISSLTVCQGTFLFGVYKRMNDKQLW